MSERAVRIEMHADVLCPWSYIAKRRLEAAQAELGTLRVGTIWRSFELSPEAGSEPAESAAQVIRNWRGDAAEARIRQIVGLGEAEGLRLDLERARPVSSFDAHGLVQLGGASGQADAMMERLLYAYHSEGANIADHGVLARLGTEAGLEAETVIQVLDGEAYGDAVRADRRIAEARGISGVPVMVVAGSPPMSAVQPVADLVKLLRRAFAAQ